MSDAFILELVDLDDVSVSREDDHLEVICRGHDGANTIEVDDDVHDAIDKHDLRIQHTTSDHAPDGGGEIRFEVVER